MKIFHGLFLMFFLLSPSFLFSSGALQWDIPHVSHGGSLFSINNSLIIILILLSFYIDRSNIKFSLFKWSLIIFIFILSFILSLGSIATTSLLFNGMDFEVLNTYVTPAIYILYALIIRKYLDSKTSSKIFELCLIVLCVAPLIIESGYQTEMRRSGTIGLSPNELGLVAAIIFAISFLKLIDSLNPLIFLKSYSYISEFSKTLYYLCIVFFSVFASLSSGSRRSVLFMLFSIMYISYLRRSFLPILIILILIIFLLNSVLFDDLFSLPLFFRTIDPNDGLSFISDDGRDLIWQRAIDFIPNQILFGLSLGQGASSVFGFSTMHAHNIFLQIFLQYGLILGSILCFGLALIFTFPLIHILLKPRTYIEYFWLIVVFYSLIFTLYDWFFFNPKFLLIFIISLSNYSHFMDLIISNKRCSINSSLNR